MIYFVRAFIGCIILYAIGLTSYAIEDDPKPSSSERSAQRSSIQSNEAIVVRSVNPSEMHVVNSNTLRHKVLCGYQGWFRCPGDPANVGWRHWSRNAKQLTPRDATFEMWPDLSGFDIDEKYPAPGLLNPDGSQAYLFSSANGKTVRRHFNWMKRYDIDGVFLQRFLVELHDSSVDLVLDHVRKSADSTGRIFAICYDLSGIPADRIVDTLKTDWIKLVDVLKVTQDRQYIKEQNQPVVFIWGLYPDRFDSKIADHVIDLFKNNDAYHARVIGGCPWYWRSEKDPQWRRVFHRLDVVSPWNVGNYTETDGKRLAATNSWKDDMIETKQAGSTFMPVIYPGFGWMNLKGKTASRSTIPRLRGEFFKRQFEQAVELGVDTAYVAMFDEVDEGTAIIPVSNTPPGRNQFSTYEGLPNDSYLKYTGEGSKMIRRGRLP